MDDDAVELARAVILKDYFHLFGISVMYWDHLITLDTEIGLLWKRTKSASAYWFFVIRYGAFVTNIPVTVFSFHTLKPKVVVCTVMILRIWALYDRSVRILLFLFGTGACIIALILWSVQGQHSESADSIPGCHVSISRSTAHHFAGTWEALFFFDALIFALTLCKTWRRGRDAHMPLHMLILRDGAMYFAGMALANLCNIITFYVRTPPSSALPSNQTTNNPQMAGPILRGSLSTFASCVSVTMMARLMLNLHAEAEAGGSFRDEDDIALGGVDMEFLEVGGRVECPDVRGAERPDVSRVERPDVNVVERPDVVVYVGRPEVSGMELPDVNERPRVIPPSELC
ncbi:hypothetical protein B0H10DRAFT_2222475 [Mycena sp. CBHHK59/15]|nr:hypothetical protein B0H10DRAFT_2222475 [Mycena sp. CBHHK59/15]